MSGCYLLRDNCPDSVSIHQRHHTGLRGSFLCATLPGSPGMKKEQTEPPSTARNPYTSDSEHRVPVQTMSGGRNLPRETENLFGLLFKVAGFKINQSALHEQTVYDSRVTLVLLWFHMLFFFLKALHFVSSLKVQVVAHYFGKGKKFLYCIQRPFNKCNHYKGLSLGLSWTGVSYRKLVCGHEII